MVKTLRKQKRLSSNAALRMMTECWRTKGLPEGYLGYLISGFKQSWKLLKLNTSEKRVIEDSKNCFGRVKAHIWFDKSAINLDNILPLFLNSLSLSHTQSHRHTHSPCLGLSVFVSVFHINILT